MFPKGFVIIVGGFTLTFGQNLFVVVVVVCLTAFVGFCCLFVFHCSVWS